VTAIASPDSWSEASQARSGVTAAGFAICTPSVTFSK
jgi:hypothetical protein